MEGVQDMRRFLKWPLNTFVAAGSTPLAVLFFYDGRPFLGASFALNAAIQIAAIIFLGRGR